MVSTPALSHDGSSDGSLTIFFFYLLFFTFYFLLFHFDLFLPLLVFVFIFYFLVFHFDFFPKMKNKNEKVTNKNRRGSPSCFFFFRGIT